MNRRTIVFSTLIIILSIFPGFAGEKSPEVIAIKGAKIIPVVGEDIEKGVIIIRDGLIEAVGKDVAVPQGARIIEAEGLLAFPGMIDGYSFLGLSEISSIPATIDHRETGRINPQVKTTEALRPDSMHIPISRANGITAALAAPSGGLIAGQSGLIRLDGWTPAEMIIKSPVALHVEFPTVARPGRPGRGETAQKDASRQVEELKDLFNKARNYQKRKENAVKNQLFPIPEFDETLEFLLPFVSGDLPLMISVHSDKDILSVIKFLSEENLKAVFFGATQAWKVAEEIGKAGIPVVLGSLYAMPPTWEDGYDSVFRNASVLHKAGVTVAFSSQSASLAKDLPYHAAKAAAFGLDKKEALRGVTINPARIFGVENLMGSLEKGKAANIVLADGDILEFKTGIKHVFIDGREVDLSNRYRELLDKYKGRE